MKYFQKKRFKGYFKSKIKTARYHIWETEFQIFQTKLERESVRKEYDNNKARLELIKAQINSTEGKELQLKNIDEFKRLEDQVVLLEKDVANGETSLKELDILVNGTAPTNTHPEGALGFIEQIKKFRELCLLMERFVKDYLSKHA